MAHRSVEITESFADPLGQFERYTSYDAEQLADLRSQEHKDVRNMRAEVWTAGTVASDPTRNNWRFLTHTLVAPTGTTTMSSTITKTGSIVPIDFTDFATGDFLTVVLPDFQLNSIDLTGSYLEVTSAANGSFSGTPPIASVQWSLHTGTSSLAHDTDSELRIPFEALDDTVTNGPIDWSAITGLRLRVKSSNGTPTFIVGAIRLVSSDWQYAALDIDTIDQVLVTPQAPNGDPNRVYDFVFPLVFRAHEPSNEHDPRPIDSSFSVIFNTGSNTGASSFSIYFRELVADFLTQLDLNGTTQAELNGKPQPDTGDGKWDPRDVDTLDPGDDGYPFSERDFIPGWVDTVGGALSMDDLEGDLLYDLERVPDFDLASWFRITMSWGTTNQIVAEDSEANAYTFDLSALNNNTLYVAFIDVEDNTFRVRLYPVSGTGLVAYDNLIFDTGEVTDDDVVKRRKGRLGWSAILADGDAYISDLRTRFLNFAEYRSFPLQSITAVEGAQIFAEHTPHRDLFTGLSVGPNGGTVVPDKSFANSDESFKITNLGLLANQGVVSNWINFENFDHYRIEYDIFYPTEAIANAPRLYLRDQSGNLIALSPPATTPDVWQHVRLYPIEGNTALTGLYQLYWVEEGTGVASTWWLDNIKAIQESMVWEARAQTDDPWGDRKGIWVNATEIVNGVNDGVMFFERGKELQVRGRALRQDVILGQVKVIPKYAELGRVVWGNQESRTNLAVGGSASAQNDDGTNISSRAIDGDSLTYWQSQASTTTWWKVDLGLHPINLATNPSFELATAPWVAADPTNVTTTVALSTAWAKAGVSSLRYTGTKDNTATLRAMGVRIGTGTAGIPVLPSTTYSLRALVNVVDDHAPGLRVRIQWYTSAGANISTSNGASQTGTGEKTLTLTATAPATAAFATLYVSGDSNTPLDTLDFNLDAVMFAQASSAPVYFDGDTEGHTWAGTPHASTSGRLRKINRAYIDWGQSYPSQYIVEVSSNNTNFTAVATVNSEGNYEQVDFGSINARYVRISPLVAAGSTGFQIHEVVVRPTLQTPTAAFTVNVGATPLIAFDASTSTDPDDGFIVAYHWAFGDGEQGYGKNISHTYPGTGTVYNVTLTVIDNHGNIDQVTDDVAA